MWNQGDPGLQSRIAKVSPQRAVRAAEKRHAGTLQVDRKRAVRIFLAPLCSEGGGKGRETGGKGGEKREGKRGKAERRKERAEGASVEGGGSEDVAEGSDRRRIAEDERKKMST